MLKRILVVVVAAMAIALAACSGSYPRGQFAGFVTDATEEQIVERVGKPDEIDTSNPERPVWVYRKRTFDPENLNQVDPRTSIILRRDAAGRLVGKEVVYS